MWRLLDGQHPGDRRGRYCVGAAAARVVSFASEGLLRRDHDAIAFYDAAIARGGFNALLRFNRALCLLRLQRNAEAADDLRAVLTLKPDWHDAHELLRTLS